MQARASPPSKTRKLEINDPSKYESVGTMRKKRYSIGIDLSKYRGKYVAIINKKVVASGADAKEVWAEVKRKYPSKMPELAKISKEETLVLTACR